VKRALIVACALAAGGCSLLLHPNRNDILDGGPDGALDAGPDAETDASDAETDASSDAGCTRFETSCTDGMDNDCDGRTDCDEIECLSAPSCCERLTGGDWPDLLPFGDWERRPRSAAITITAAPDPVSVVFPVSSTPVAIRHGTCAPIAFGMSFQLDFEVRGTHAGDFAALALSPVSEPGPDGFVSEFRLVVRSDGSMQAERAGAVLNSLDPGAVGAAAVPAEIKLSPGVDDAGRAVLFVTVVVEGERLVDRAPLMPLERLRDTASCPIGGLYLVLEGQGSSVVVASALTAKTLDCDNPTQFSADAMSSPLRDVETRFDASGMWRAGGLGEPSISEVCIGAAGCSDRLDVLADGTDLDRSEELLRPLSLSIGGALYLGGSWSSRDASSMPQLLGPMTSSREPDYLIPIDDMGAAGEALLAYAEEQASGGGVHDLVLRALGRNRADAPGRERFRLSPSDVGCRSLRDPVLVANGTTSTDRDLTLFFTCEPMDASGHDSIGAARLVYGMGSDDYALGMGYPELLTATPGTYTGQGVSSPEAVVTDRNADGSVALRLWFLAKDGSGRARLAMAYGDIDAEGVPALSAYPGNPLLDPENQVLGGSCPSGCAIESFGVLRSVAGSLFWRDPSYVFLIERSVFRSTGTEHQLLPLVQRRPVDG